MFTNWSVYFALLSVIFFFNIHWTVPCAFTVIFIFKKSSKKRKIPNRQEGYYAQGWKNVVDLYRKHLDDGWQEGGAFAVYHKGQLVAELSGGYSDEGSHLEWTKDTLSQFYSTTKAVAAVVMAICVDRGFLEYEKPVCHYWPEFAQNGKDDITVLQLLSHQAGLSAIDEPFSVRDGDEVISHCLAKQAPHWKPGTGCGYHTMSIGYYEDQLVKRIDPQHRSLSRFFADEVAKPFDIDFYIGLPKEENNRCARNTNASFSLYRDLLGCYQYWPLMFDLITGKDNLLRKSFINPRGLGETDVHHNQPSRRSITCPSSHGFGTAIAVAKLFGILANGGKCEKLSLLSEEAVDLLARPVVSGKDKTLKLDVTYGRGVTLWKSPKENYIFGAPGMGSQIGKCDPKHKLGIAFLTNHHTIYGFGDDPRYLEIEKAIYDTLDNLDE